MFKYKTNYIVYVLVDLSLAFWSRWAAIELSHSYLVKLLILVLFLLR